MCNIIGHTTTFNQILVNLLFNSFLQNYEEKLNSCRKMLTFLQALSFRVLLKSTSFLIL